jgi:hypothetical protein
MPDKRPVPGLDRLTDAERCVYAQTARELAGAEPVEPHEVAPTATGARVLCWIEIEREDMVADEKPR